MKNIVLAAAFVSALTLAAPGQQQQRPFTPPATAPTAPPTPPSAATPTPAPTEPIAPVTPVTPVPGVDTGVAPGNGTITNGTARPEFGAQATAQNQQQTGGAAPLFLNLSGATVMDANGQPMGTIQQIVLSPSGSINFAVASMGGRMIPVPWQLVGTVPGRTGLTINADRSLLQQAPPVLMNQLPMLTQDAVLEQIYGHFNVPVPNNPTVVGTTTAQGRPGAAEVTIAGGATNIAVPTTPIPTNPAAGSRTLTNQAVNTTSGLLSPTGRTNAAFDGYNSGPGSTDRFGPRQNANPTTPPPRP